MKRSARLSWRWKLPLLIASVCSLAIVAFAMVAYREVRQSALGATYTRFRSALSEITAITSLGMVNQLDVLKASARDPAIVEAVRLSPTPQRVVAPATNGRKIAPDAIEALSRLRARSGAERSIMAVELVDAGGQVVKRLSSVEIPADSTPIAATTEAGVGRILHADSMIYFWSSAPVVDAGVIRGQVRVARQIGAGAANRRLVTTRLGKSAMLLIGNGDTTAWSGNAWLRVPQPDTALGRYLRDGQARVAASKRPFDGASWYYTIELPEADALAPAHALILPMISAGVFIALASAALGLLLSRGITEPLSELTDAAEAMARGDRNVHLRDSGREDEIGRLSRAFAAMADSVQGMLMRLESEVDARSGELNAAVDRLEVLHDTLRQHERLAALGRNFGNVGHELRNPLGVMSNVALLLDTVPDASPKLAQYAALLREQIRLSQRIISDLLDGARRGVAAESSVNIGVVLDRMLSQVAVPASITVMRRYDRSLPMVTIDVDRVGQILWNLLGNAIHAMPDGGTLTVEAELRDARLLITIADTGSGVASHDRERIFQPLYTTKPDGVGLGLSISREYARANGGDLHIVDAERGARFVLELPCRTA